MHVGFPFFLDDRGRVYEPDESEHIRQMIEQLLFTGPGERVNRPDFGAGLLTLVFGSRRAEELNATRYLVQESLQRYLGKLIDVKGVEISKVDSAVIIVVRYVERATRSASVAEFEIEAP